MSMTQKRPAILWNEGYGAMATVEKRPQFCHVSGARESARAPDDRDMGVFQSEGSAQCLNPPIR